MACNETNAKYADKSGILVIGAGELGSAVIEGLTHYSQHAVDRPSISVMVSPSSDLENQSLSDAKRSFLRHLTDDLGVRILPFDLHQSSTNELSSALRPFHTIISCSGFGGPVGLQKKIAECTLAGSVPYFIPWQYGVDYDIIGKDSAQDLFTEQLEVRAMLRRQSETQFNIISVGVFMSFLFEPAFGVVDTTITEGPIVRALGAWDYELTATTAEDIGKCVADIVLGSGENRRVGAVDGVLFLAGDTLTYDHLATIVEDAQAKPVKRELWDLAYLKNELRKDPENGLIKYRCIWAEGTGVAWPKAKSFNVRRGIEMVTAKDFAEKNLGQERKNVELKQSLSDR